MQKLLFLLSISQKDVTVLTNVFLQFTEITLALKTEEKAKNCPGWLQMEEYV